MRVVIAPDKFKGCLTAAEVADALAEGLLSARPDLEVTRFPVADGGDGTVAAALSRGFTEVAVEAAGPTGVVGPTAYARRGELAVIELAAVCGLDRLPGGRPDPLGATTYGLGTVVRHAIGNGVTRIVLGSGRAARPPTAAPASSRPWAPSCSTPPAASCRPGGAALARLVRLDLDRPRGDRWPECRSCWPTTWTTRCSGPRGAAAVFGPQKGATAAGRRHARGGAPPLGGVVEAQTGPGFAVTPGAGAAGGTGFAALALLGAHRRDGIELILELLGFEAVLAGADLVITGEGALDEQTLAGKAPIGVARAARRAGVPVVAVAGRNDLSPGPARSAPASAPPIRCPHWSPTSAAAWPRPRRCCAASAPGSPPNTRRDSMTVRPSTA